MTWAPDYATPTQLKGWVRVSDNVDDIEIATVITAASRAIDNATKRQFGQVAVAEARTYPAVYSRHTRGWLVETDDLQDITSFSMTIDGVAFTDYSFEPVNALKKGRVYTRLALDSPSWGYSAACQTLVTVTALWGWSSVPTTVLQALKVQGARLLARRDSPFGVAGSPDQGSELRLLSRLDADVELMLKPYARSWWAV